MIRSFLLGVVFLLFLVFLPIALAQETLPLEPRPTPTPVEYMLPYPGLLPDHPLYIIKQLRDQILLNLISNPVKKAEFHILLADKHVAMSTLLLDKDKPDLAIASIAKSQEHLSSAEQIIMTVPIETDDAVANTKHRLEASMHKQMEVLTRHQMRVGEDHRELLETHLQTLRKLLEDFQNKK